MIYKIDDMDRCKKDVIDDLTDFYNKRDNEIKEKYLQFLIIIIIIYIFVIIIGTIIFMFMFGLNWVNGLYTAVLVLTGINIEVNPITDGQKLFIVIYALLTVIILLSFANVVVEYFLI
jgi:hypothetical protein